LLRNEILALSGEMVHMTKEILNMEEAAEFFNVSVKTFIKLLKEEKVPARKIGREWRFSSEALIKWLASGDSQQYSSSESDTREFFDKVAPEWETIRGSFYDDEVVKRLTDSGLLEKDATLIDMGTGDGYLARSAAKNVSKVIAVDISGEMLKTLIEKAEKSGIKNIETVESDGCDMPIEDEAADVVCANMFLHHIEEPLLAIREMYRVLKPGGKAFLADLREHGNVEFKNRMHDIWPGFSQKEVKGWFEKCEFKNIKIESIDKKSSVKKADDGIFIVIAEK
jgi:excisionase family DNA binding protein